MPNNQKRPKTYIEELTENLFPATKKALVKNVIVIAPLFLSVCFIGIPILFGHIVTLFTIIGFVLFIIGIFNLLKALFTKTIAFSCPSCKTITRIKRNIKWFRCLHCQFITYFEGDIKFIKLINCAYCGVQFALGENVNTFICDNCLVRNKKREDKIFHIESEEYVHCNCNKLHPKEALFCLYCGRDKHDEMYGNAVTNDMDGLVNPTRLCKLNWNGNLHYASGMLEAIKRKLASTYTSTDEEVLYYFYILKRLREIIDSLGEVACFSPEPNIINPIMNGVKELFITLTDCIEKIVKQKKRLLSQQSSMRKLEHITSHIGLKSIPDHVDRVAKLLSYRRIAVDWKSWSTICQKVPFVDAGTF